MDRVAIAVAGIVILGGVVLAILDMDRDHRKRGR